MVLRNAVSVFFERCHTLMTVPYDPGILPHLRNFGPAREKKKLDCIVIVVARGYSQR